MIPYVVPAVAISLITKWIFNGDYGIASKWLQDLGIIAHKQSPLALFGGAMAVLIIVNVWRSYPFPMLIYWAALKGINKELYEAAHVDGANRLQLFRYITLPQLKNTTIVLIILRIVWTATYFDLYLDDNRRRTSRFHAAPPDNDISGIIWNISDWLCISYFHFARYRVVNLYCFLCKEFRRFRRLVDQVLKGNYYETIPINIKKIS